MSDGKKMSQGHETFFFFTFGLIDKLVRGTARTKTATTCFNLQRVSSDKTRLPREVFTG